MSETWRKIKTFVKQITAEPALLFYVLVADLVFITVSPLWYRKVCLALYHDEQFCDNIKQNETAEAHVEEVTSQWQFYSSLAYNIPALIFVFVYGQLSDLYSRKVPIIMPFIGLVLETLVFLLASIYMESPLPLMLLGGFCSGICGGGTTVLMGTVSYISDIVEQEKRTLRISVLYGFSSGASLITLTFSGVLYDATGFEFVFGLSLIVGIMGLAYVVFVITDIKYKYKKDNDKSDDVKNNRGINVLEQLLAHVRAVLGVSFWYRKFNDRVHILVLGVVIVCEMLGTASRVNYLYTQHPPLSFTQSMYGFFNGYRYLNKTLCMFIVVPLLKRFNIKDTMILLAAIISVIGEQIFLSLSVETWMCFVASTIGFMGGSTFVCIRGLLSGMVGINELGKIFALMAVVENLGSLLSSALYSYFLYPLTVDVFAGFCYVIGSIILLIPGCLTIWLHVDLRKFIGIKKTADGDLNRLSDDFFGNNEIHLADTMQLNSTIITDKSDEKESTRTDITKY